MLTTNPNLRRRPSQCLRAAALLAPALLAPFALGSAAPAQLQSVGPFVGDLGEGFEGQTPGVYGTCLGAALFAGKAELCTPGTSGANVATSFTLSCTSVPRSGALCYGSVDGATEITFSEPVRSFGGWFAVSGAAPVIEVTFYDWEAQPNAFLEYATVSTDCQWNWLGWSSPEFAISKVRIAGTSWNNGAFVEMDDLQIELTNVWRTYCEGDGSAGLCPCSNAGADGSGCSNSSSALGAQLLATGNPSVSAPGFALVANHLPAAELVVFAEAKLSGYGQAPSSVGDGLLCLGGPLSRMHVGLSTAAGTAIAANALGSPTLLPGSDRHYQLWYRDPSGSPCGGLANLTNALSVRWLP